MRLRFCLCCFYVNYNPFPRNYVVEKRDKRTGEWIRCSDPIRGTETTISKLKDGQEYEFRVMAENENGLSEPLVTDRPVLVKNPFSMLLLSCIDDIEMNLLFLDEPGAPGTPECKSRDRDHIEIKWTPPRNDGGNPVQGYIVERREISGKRRDWTPLERGDLQRVRVYIDFFLSFTESPHEMSREKLVIKTH